MRSILEKAFVALLNEEHDKAEEMFHKFIVERARQIHESNRAGEDYVLDENWNDEITTESYFTEDDLADLEGDDDHAEGEEGHDEFGAEGDDMGDEMAGDEAGDDMPMDDGMGDEEMGAEEGEGTPEERIDHLEDQIEKLTAEFEAMMDAIGDDGEEVHDEMSDDEASMDDDGMGDEFGGDEADAEHVEDDMDGTDEMPAMEGEEHEDEDEMMESDEFDDITESIIDELEKVSVSLDDGHEIGTGKSFTQNKSASIPQKSKDARQGGAPIKMKRDDHKGFERETAPAVTDMKTRRNTLKKADSTQSKVSKEGNKSAEINKLSSETGNTKSPLEGK